MSKMEGYRIMADDNKIIVRDLVDVVSNDMKNYAPYVILSRSIPDARDGLKPVQRRMLYTSHELKLTPNAKHMKLARLAGQNMAYHPHGDNSASDAAVTMSKDWEMMLPLIDIHGSNGSIDGSTAAADRYISARQSEHAPLLLEELNQKSVKMVDNFDNTLKEPEVLPTQIPNALINGTKAGIAIGVSTMIAPHNPYEVMKGLIAVAENKIKKDKDIFKYIKGPDFPTGCDIVGQSGVNDLMLNGHGRIVMQSTMEIVIPDKKKDERYIQLSNIPYGLTTKKVIESIQKVSEELVTLGVKAFRDETQVNDISIKIICDSKCTQSDMEKIRDFLIQKTNIRHAINPNNTMIHKGTVKSFNMIDYLNAFIEFRLDTLHNIWSYEQDKKAKRKHIVDGVLRLEELTDKIVAIAKQSKGKSDMATTLVSKLSFSDEQAQVIVDIPLYRLGKLNFETLQKEHDELVDTLNQLDKFLNEPSEAKKEMVRQFKLIEKQFKSMKRQSNIIDDKALNIQEIRLEDTIEEKDVTVVVREDLTIQRIGNVAFDNQIGKYKNDDIVATFKDVKTTDYILAITKTGQVVTRLVHDLPHDSLDGKFEPLSREIPKLKSNDMFIGGAIIDPYNEQSKQQKMVIMTEHGYVKGLQVGVIMPNTNTRKYIKILGKAHGLKSTGDSVVYAKVVNEDTFKDKTVTYTLRDDTKKSGDTVERSSVTDDFYNMKHGATGSGVWKINTKKDGKFLPFISLSIE